MAKAAGRTTERRASPLPEEWQEDEEPEVSRPRRRKARAQPVPDPEPLPGPPLGRRIAHVLIRGVLGLLAAFVGVLVLFGAVAPPTTPYMLSESHRLGGIEQAWVPLEEIAPAMPRSAVAAEDARFCAHWGLDLVAIRAAMASGGDRGGSTISQQVAKNVFLWQGRSWSRKALEAAITPAMEALWSKRRILEVYLNVAEFGDGVFGVEAAAQHYFGVHASDLSDRQAALLAASLPDPKDRDPADPSAELSRRADQIMDGAATIARDGRAACFQAGP